MTLCCKSCNRKDFTEGQGQWVKWENEKNHPVLGKRKRGSVKIIDKEEFFFRCAFCVEKKRKIEEGTWGTNYSFFNNSESIEKIEKQVDLNKTTIKATANQLYKRPEKLIEVHIEEEKNYRKEKKKKDALEQSQNTIFKFEFKKHPYHSGGWIFFFILLPLGISYWYKLKNKKRKINLENHE